jgi:chromosome partitioning protein
MSELVCRRASVITVLNLKGGVGKTHTSWLLASVCEERGKRLLAIDTDPQGNLSSSFLASDAIEPGMEILFDPSTDISTAGLVRRTKFSHIDVVPTGPKLARFDLSDQRQWEAADLHLTLREPISAWRPLYDYIVFDCPPRLSLVSYAALCASDFVIIPLEAADWGAQGIMQVTEAIEHVREFFNPRLQLLGYMVSRFKRSRSVQKAYLRELREHFGAKAFDTVIPDLASFEQSVIERIPVTLRPRHRRTAGIARDFFDEVERRIADLQSRGGAGRATDVRQSAVIAA